VSGWRLLLDLLHLVLRLIGPLQTHSVRPPLKDGVALVILWTERRTALRLCFDTRQSSQRLRKAEGTKVHGCDRWTMANALSPGSLIELHAPREHNSTIISLSLARGERQTTHTEGTDDCNPAACCCTLAMQGYVKTRQPVFYVIQCAALDVQRKTLWKLNFFNNSKQQTHAKRNQWWKSVWRAVSGLLLLSSNNRFQ
jgi:hypothetical protein